MTFLFFWLCSFAHICILPPHPCPPRICIYLRPPRLLPIGPEPCRVDCEL